MENNFFFRPNRFLPGARFRNCYKSYFGYDERIFQNFQGHTSTSEGDGKQRKVKYVLGNFLLAEPNIPAVGGIFHKQMKWIHITQIESDSNIFRFPLNWSWFKIHNAFSCNQPSAVLSMLLANLYLYSLDGQTTLCLCFHWFILFSSIYFHTFPQRKES